MVYVGYNKYSSAVAETARPWWFLRGWATLRLNLRWRVTFLANVYGTLDRGMIILQLCPESFHTKKLCSRLYSIDEVDLYSKNEKIAIFFERGGSLWAQMSDGRGHWPPTIVGVRKLQWLQFRLVSKYRQCIVWFCHEARMLRTDKQRA